MKYRPNGLFPRALVLIALAAGLEFSPAARAEQPSGARYMPVPRQNAVLKKYCGGCQSDALMYGGLSVQHFDAAYPDPSVAAMLVSKLTSGLTPQDVQAATRGPDPETNTMALLHGAMGASGSQPDEATQIAFARALSAESAGAQEWHSGRSTDSEAAPRTITADIIRPIASTKFPGKIDMYRLILSCRVDTREGEIRLAWANGVPDEGQPMTVSIDGKVPFIHKAEGGKQQGNGANGPGATILYPDSQMRLPFPEQSLTVSGLFPNETVTFPFEGLGADVRRQVAGCFNPPIETSK